MLDKIALAPEVKPKNFSKNCIKSIDKLLICIRIAG